MFPSLALIENLKILNSEFCSFHGEYLKVETKNVIIDFSKQLADNIHPRSRFSSIDESIINLFIRTRTFARLKAINKLINEEKRKLTITTNSKRKNKENEKATKKCAKSFYNAALNKNKVIIFLIKIFYNVPLYIINCFASIIYVFHLLFK